MKTLPKYTDLVAQADDFIIFSKGTLVNNQLEQQAYLFDNDYTATVILWSGKQFDTYDNQVEVDCWSKEGDILERWYIVDEKELRQKLEAVKSK